MKRKGKGKDKPKPKGIIPEPVLSDSQTIQFSFKHIDLNNGKFGPTLCPQEFWLPFLSELHRYSQFPVDSFEDQNNGDHRHTITFDDTSEPAGFAHLDMEQLGYVQVWQFAVGIRRWRVVGFLVAPIFYIVWLDPNHALYDGRPEDIQND